MTNLQLSFNYEQLQVRTVSDAVGIWFVLRDVCILLGIVDDKQVYDRLDDDERGRYKVPTPGGMQEMRCVNEPGLYEVIIRSNSEKAKPFRRWITHEVLPSIRQKGYYALMSDEQLVSIILAKARANRDFLKLIDKRTINAQLLAESREKKQLDSDLLYLSREKYDNRTYRHLLQDIWGDDTIGLRKAYEEYREWWDEIGYKMSEGIK